MANKVVCVYDSASNNIDEAYKEQVFSLGATLARNNYDLIYGAGATGLMGAIAEGFVSENGKVVGVTPHFMHEFEPIYDKLYCAINTTTMDERKSIMKNNADAFIIAPGGIGTLDEFFETLTEKELSQHNKPIIIYNCLGFYTKLMDLLNEYSELGFIRKSVLDMFTVCDTIDEIIKTLADAM